MTEPIILFENQHTESDLARLKEEKKIWQVRDNYLDQVKEVFEITYPGKKETYDQQLKDFIAKYTKTKKDGLLVGNWVYYPWNGFLVRTIGKHDYFQLRTNRNRNLITAHEQQKLSEACVGIAGLSVGSSIATGLAYHGVGAVFKLAEFDTLETTNLNRIKAGLHQIGLPKLDVVCQQVYEVNPYATIDRFEHGLTKENLNDFVCSPPRPSVIFEIIDDLKVKILLRIEARKAGIPVISLANVGDSLIIDIERYDLDQSLEIFNGLLGNLQQEILDSDRVDVNKYAVRLVGIENVPIRALESVKEIGRTLVGRPQLSSTVTVSSGLGAYLTRKIILGDPLQSGRYKVSFDTLFGL